MKGGSICLESNAESRGYVGLVLGNGSKFLFGDESIYLLGDGSKSLGYESSPPPLDLHHIAASSIPEGIVVVAQLSGLLGLSSLLIQSAECTGNRM